MAVIEVAKVILFDRNQQVLIYLRDNKPSISYPNYWDLLGGMVEIDESPQIALIREVQEEIGVHLEEIDELGHYISKEGSVFHLFWGKIDATPDELTLTEGQQLTSMAIENRTSYRFPPVLEQALNDFAISGKIM